jgi:drug/metabolite transporter (DMT)-like permease
MIYLSITAVLLTATLWAALKGFEQQAHRTWGPLVFATVIAFAILIAPLRRLWRKWRFWATLAVLLIVHFLAFAVLFAYATEWRPIWTVGILLAESVFFLFVSPWLWHKLKIDP